MTNNLPVDQMPFPQTVEEALAQFEKVETQKRQIRRLIARERKAFLAGAKWGREYERQRHT